jgi:phosphinothricin acetyltransferase
VGITVRRATLDDAEAIRAIYNAEVTGSTVTFDLVPRTAEEQRAWLVERSGAYAVLVAEDDDGAIAGFASLSPYRDRPAYATTVEDSVYVDHSRRGAGVGRALLEELVATATAHGFHTVIARIVGHHEASIGLHRRVGFDEVGTEREVGRKMGRWLDVVVMQRLLTD